MDGFSRMRRGSEKDTAKLHMNWMHVELALKVTPVYASTGVTTEQIQERCVFVNVFACTGGDGR
jgi:hypothetical protein